jgi:hypothetical protein
VEEVLDRHAKLQKCIVFISFLLLVGLALCFVLHCFSLFVLIHDLTEAVAAREIANRAAHFAKYILESPLNLRLLLYVSIIERHAQIGILPVGLAGGHIPSGELVFF